MHIVSQALPADMTAFLVAHLRSDTFGQKGQQMDCQVSESDETDFIPTAWAENDASVRDVITSITVIILIIPKL